MYSKLAQICFFELPQLLLSTAVADRYMNNRREEKLLSCFTEVHNGRKLTMGARLHRHIQRLSAATANAFSNVLTLRVQKRTSLLIRHRTNRKQHHHLVKLGYYARLNLAD